MPGLKLDKSGVWHLSAGDQQVELKSADVSFDDDKGISVTGYTLGKDGSWMEITPESQLALDLEKWGMTMDKYNVGYDKDGKIELRQNGTNKLIYWDGRWASNIAMDMVKATNDCKETIYVPASSKANWAKEGQVEELNTYIFDIVKKAEDASIIEDIYKSKIFWRAVPFRDENNCWGVFVGSTVDGEINRLVWQKENREVGDLNVFNEYSYK